MATYTLDNSWEHAKRRLARLEQYLDPITRRRVSMLGIQQGWRCLEVGGGGGSVAAWLCEQVGPNGGVIATDIKFNFLSKSNMPISKLSYTTSQVIFCRKVHLISFTPVGCSTTCLSRNL